MKCLNKSNPEIKNLLQSFKEPVLSKILDTFPEDYIPTKEEALDRYNELKVNNLPKKYTKLLKLNSQFLDNNPLENTKKLAIENKIINKNNKLVNSSGETLTKFGDFIAYIKELASNKFNGIPTDLPNPMKLRGEFVEFNEKFFDWIDRENKFRKDLKITKQIERDAQNRVLQEQRLNLEEEVKYSTSQQSDNLSNLDYDIKIAQYFGETKEQKASKLLKDLVNTNNYLGQFAIKFLEQIDKNDVNVKLLTEQEAEDYLKKHEAKIDKLSVSEAGGFYLPKTNEIVIIDRPSGLLDRFIIHEIGHALSYEVLRNNPELKAEFEKLLKTTKAFFTEEENKKFAYELSNIDEFFTALSLPSFVKTLQSKPSISGQTSSLWQDIKNFLAKLVNKIVGNNPTLADDYFNLVDRVLNTQVYGLESDNGKIQNNKVIIGNTEYEEYGYIFKNNKWYAFFGDVINYDEEYEESYVLQEQNKAFDNYNIEQKNIAIEQTKENIQERIRLLTDELSNISFDNTKIPVNKDNIPIVFKNTENISTKDITIVYDKPTDTYYKTIYDFKKENIEKFGIPTTERIVISPEQAKKEYEEEQKRIEKNIQLLQNQLEKNIKKIGINKHIINEIQDDELLKLLNSQQGDYSQKYYADKINNLIETKVDNANGDATKAIITHYDIVKKIFNVKYSDYINNQLLKNPLLLKQVDEEAFDTAQEILDYLSEELIIHPIYKYPLMKGLTIEDTDIKNIEQKRIQNEFEKYVTEKESILKRIKELEKPITPKKINNTLNKSNDNQLLGAKTNDVNEQIDNIVEEIKDLDSSKIAEIVNEHFEVVNKHLLNLKTRPSYSRLKKIFSRDNTNKVETLQDLLKRADKAVDDIAGIQRKVRAIAISVVQMEHFSNLIREDVKEIVKDKENAVENLHVLQSYLNTLSDYQILLEQTSETFPESDEINNKIGEISQKIKGIERLILKNDEAGIVKTLKDILVPAGQEYIFEISKLVNSEKQTLKRQEDRKADPKRIQATKDRIKAYEDKIKEIDFENDENILAFLKGERGDSKLLNTFLESFRDSSDPTISGFATFVKNIIDGADEATYKIAKEYEREIAPFYDNLSRFDPQKLGGQLTFIDNRVTSDGKKQQVVALLNPWKNYQADLQTLKNAENTAKKEFEKTNSEEDKKIYKDARKERIQFESDFMHREYKPEVYEVYKLYDDEIGQELKRRSDEIWDRINQLTLPYTILGQELDEETLNAIDSLQREYKFLGKLTTLEGVEKEGMELAIAKRMQEVRKLNVKYFEYKPNLTMFEKARNAHSEFLIAKGYNKDTPEYATEMDKWMSENTIQVAKKEAYEKRQKILNLIKAKLKRSKAEEIKNIKIGEIWDKILDITKGLRDENNIPEGQLFSQEQQEKILELELELQKAKKAFNSFTGFTEEQQNRFSELYTKKITEGLSVDEELEYDELKEISKDMGLTASTKKQILEHFEELKKLTRRIPSEYYVEEYNNLASKYGFTIDKNGKIGEIDALNEDLINQLLEHEDFAEWFKRSHIRVNRYNPVIKAMEEVWERTYIWSQIEFTDPNDYEHTTLSDGTTFKGKPAPKYSNRVIKDEYRTEKVVGKTVDNRGNWLPRTTEEGALDNRYVNEKYFDLKKKNKELSNLLDIHTKYLLSTQENLTNQHKLWLDLPRLAKEGTERNLRFLDKALKSPGKIPAHIWERIKDKVDQLFNFDVSERRYTPKFEGRYNKEFLSVPMKYTGYLEPENVSLDIPRAIMKYTQSSELNKSMVENIPVAKAIERIVDVYATKSKKWYIPDAYINRRRVAIRRIIAREFAGQRKGIEFNAIGEEKSSKYLELIIRGLQSAIGIKYVKFNIPSAVANWINGELQNLLNTGNGLYSPQDFAVTEAHWWKFMTGWTKDYAENKLGKLSLESQLIDLWQPIMGKSIESQLGEKISSSKVKDALAGSWFFSFRGQTEFRIQSRPFIAALYATKVDRTYKGEDGKLTTETISLLDAYELDANGIIKLKDGIDKSWDIKGRQFNRLKAKIQALNRRTHGAYSKFDESFMEAYAIFSLVNSLKRFFVAQANNRFAYGDTLASPRYNIQGDAGSNHGWYPIAIAAFQKFIRNGAINISEMTDAEKRAFVRIAFEWSFLIATPTIIMMLMGYSGDDKNKKKKLEQYSWLELQLLYQLDRAAQESKTFYDVSQYTQFVTQPMFIPVIEQHYKFANDLISLEEYKEDYSIYKKGDLKAKADFLRLTGIQQGILFKDNPDEMLKAYDLMTRGR